MHAVAQVLTSRPPTQLRDSDWLDQELRHLWGRCFAEVPRANTVKISFAGSWKSRLGVITLSEDRQTSYIGINSLLSLPEAPPFVARITVAHELVHYAHGFGSPLPRRHRHPHRGRIVERELVARGLREEYLVYHEWVQSQWYDFYEVSAMRPVGSITQPVLSRTRESYESQ